MKKKKVSYVQQKIDFDKKTAEPYITETFESGRETPVLPKEPKDYTGKPLADKQVKQLTMNKLLGLETDRTIDKRQRLYKNLVSLAFIVFVLAVLVITAYDDFFSNKSVISFDQLLKTFSVTWFYLPCAIFALFINYLLKGTKLSILCKAQTKKWHFKTCMETGVLGHYYNSVTPLAVGGQPFEIYHLSKHGVTGGAAYSLPIATYVLNQIAFVILGILSLVLYNYNLLDYDSHFYGHIPALITTLALIGCSLCLFMPLAVVLFSIFPKASATLVRIAISLGNKLKLVKNPKLTNYKTMRSVCKNAKSLKNIAKHPWAFIFTFILSFGETLAHASIAYFTLKFFNFNWAAAHIYEWFQVVTICIIISLAITFIPTPGNSGAADFSFYTLFNTQLEGGLAFPAMMTWRILNFYSYIIIGFIFTRIKKHTDAKPKK